MTDTNSDMLTAAQLARAWGVSRQNIHQLAKKGIIPRRSDGLFDEREARRAYLRNSDPAYRRAPNLDPAVVNHSVKAAWSGAVNQVNGDSFDDRADYLAAKAVKEHYRAGLARLDYKTRTGILVDAGVVKAQWFKTLRMVRDRILQLPERLAPTLVAESEPEKVRAILRAEITRIIEDAETPQT